MDWARILAYVTGMVDQELLARNEYLAAENRILKAQLKGRKLSNAERATLGEMGHRLGRKVLGEVAARAHSGLKLVRSATNPLDAIAPSTRARRSGLDSARCSIGTMQNPQLLLQW